MLDIARSRMRAVPAWKAAQIEAIVEADARDLGAFQDSSFDAVLCLGPFYHLIGQADRDRAAEGAYRVLRPGGLLVAAVMPPYMRLVSAVLVRGSAAFDAGTVRDILGDGRCQDERLGRFTRANLMRPDEVVPFFERHGFRTRRRMASQGFLSWAQPEVAALAQRDPGAYQRLLDVAYATAADPSIHGMAGHLLFVGARSQLAPAC